jgi:hypothetical protein
MRTYNGFDKAFEPRSRGQGQSQRSLLRQVRHRSKGLQTVAAALVFGCLMVSCVSTSADEEFDTRPVLTENDEVYGEITAGLDSPLWDEGDGSDRHLSDNAIDHALSQSPYKEDNLPKSKVRSARASDALVAPKKRQVRKANQPQRSSKSTKATKANTSKKAVGQK